MNKVGTKTVRKIAQSLGIQTGYSWTDKPYVNESLRYVCIANVTEQQAEDLESTLFELGYEDSPVRWRRSPHGWNTEYVRIAKCLFEPTAVNV